ncbi:hypothetical protein Anapl_15707 [Anas platyrhynchos]|uniref:Uncharacterized protein n=1 Tax=Anas platyrhynchos TaxID=8839 RepID=R0LMF9_ANAPL|nr:hypothetical protein Anapl_15707 [Anas platyrhynchos]
MRHERDAGCTHVPAAAPEPCLLPDVENKSAVTSLMLNITQLHDFQPSCCLQTALITGMEQVEDTELFPAQKSRGLASCESSLPTAMPRAARRRQHSPHMSSPAPGGAHIPASRNRKQLEPHRAVPAGR